ncbi:hypothetical protein, partial [Reichenbachiella agariperforans]
MKANYFKNHFALRFGLFLTLIFMGAFSVLAQPTITGLSVSSDNSYADVTFSEGVYNTNGGSGALELGDFSPSLSGGVAVSPVISSVTQNDNVVEGSASSLVGGESVVRIFFSYTNTADGSETLEI